jgi:hypothetical protein
MGCVIHVMGDLVDVDTLIENSPVEPCAVFRKGQPRSLRPNSRLCSTSGVNFVVSNADFDDFDQQKHDATVFVTRHATALAKLLATPGIDHASIDFGISMRDVIAQSDGFEPALIRAIAPIGLQLVLSQYPVARRQKRIKQYRRSLRNP